MVGALNDQINTRILQFLASPLHGALEPESESFMFIRPDYINAL